MGGEVFIEPRLQAVLRVCPPAVQSRLRTLESTALSTLEEIRIRVHQPVQLCGGRSHPFLHKERGVTASVNDAYTATQNDVQEALRQVTGSSLYAVEEDLRRGFVTIAGGHRVGLAGRAVLEGGGSIRTLRSVSSLNIRIAQERLGVAKGLLFALNSADQAVSSTLLISPPQCGKTTYLRDLARLLSSGSPPQVRPLKVTIVDERSEVAGCVEGIPQFDVGPRTDVLDGCPKAEGMLMAIRSLSPDVVVTDEIGRADDRDAILEASQSGVSIVTTAHARSLEEWRQRPYMQELFDARAFKRYVILSRRHGPGTIEAVLDHNARPLRVPVERGEWG